MRIHVDQAACSGHGRCHALAPTVYELDEEGYNTTEVREVGPEDEEAARLGALSCPEGAITIDGLDVAVGGPRR